MYETQDVKIDVETKTLISTLKLNREIHETNYRKAIEVYRKELRTALADRLELLENPSALLKVKKWADFRDIKCPETYTRIYDRVIEMLELHEPDIITINGEQYGRWIKDIWDWSGAYQLNTLSKL